MSNNNYIIDVYLNEKMSEIKCSKKFSSAIYEFDNIVYDLNDEPLSCAFAIYALLDSNFSDRDNQC